MYATHPLMVIDPCAKYGKPMLKQKKLRANHETAQANRWTDRVIPIYPPELCSQGSIIISKSMHAQIIYAFFFPLSYKFQYFEQWKTA